MKYFTCVIISLFAINLYAFEIAPKEQALTLARTIIDKKINTLLVTEANESNISAINISKELNLYSDYPMDIFRGSKNFAYFYRLYERNELITSFNRSSLLPASNNHTKHIGAAGNYAAHANETNLDPTNVVVFPKIGNIYPAMNNLLVLKDDLMDYEVELCATFDRDIHSIDDYKESIVGVFLCNDWSERTPIIMKYDSTRPDLAGGLTDAKSGPGRFQAGSFLVVPTEHNSFIKTINLNLKLNGEVKQNSQVSKLILKIEDLVDLTLTTGTESLWYLGEENISLIPEGFIEKGMAILTGTPEGVIFRPPSSAYKIGYAARYIFFGILGPWYKDGMVDYIRKSYIKKLQKKNIFLRPGDQVISTGTYLGEIQTHIISK